MIDMPSRALTGWPGARLRPWRQVHPPVTGQKRFDPWLVRTQSLTTDGLSAAWRGVPPGREQGRGSALETNEDRKTT